uniref:Adaptor related protein complex 3 subunit sigma 2 n=1 Tax=Labrus bergylta TaxID=56723 RepID=A0A3Q3M5Q8_9LABR
MTISIHSTRQHNSKRWRFSCSYFPFSYLREDMQQQIIRETFHLVSKRDDNVCNFLRVGGNLIGGSDYKLIYRHYATLYFVFCVDSSESELGILDLIQVFVETLDKCFENVCELDLIFHMDKVSGDGGMVLETNMNEIVAQVELQTRMEKSEVTLCFYHAVTTAMKNEDSEEVQKTSVPQSRLEQSEQKKKKKKMLCLIQAARLLSPH